MLAPSDRRRLYCSVACQDYSIPGRRAVAIEIWPSTCVGCGAVFIGRRAATRWCSERCAHRARKRHRRHLERAAQRGRALFTLRQIAERDGWRCHLCGKKVTDRPYKARPLDPTIDHLVPVSAGGEHVMANVALAHNRCNWERSDGGAAQLRLIA